jgi:hypothetical protein
VTPRSRTAPHVGRTVSNVALLPNQPLLTSTPAPSDKTES